ncbi:putative microcin-H47 secretion/processing ATP-binding protein MchF [Gammaproteobacteria bacterium]
MSELAKRLHFSFGRKLPMIHQAEVAECGLACLAMIASFHGYDTDLLTLRRQFSISLKGSRLQDLIDLAKKLHLLSRAVKLDLEDLKHLKTPCILHWDLDHFVVLKKVQGNKVIIHDPAIGVVKYKMAEVSKHFTGVAMELTPAIDFEKKKNKTRLYLSDLWGSITGLKLPLMQIVLVSLALEVFAIISPLFMQFVMDDVLTTKDYSLLYILAIGFGMLTVIQMVTGYVRSWIVMFLSNVLNIQLMANLVRHLFRLPLEFFQKRHMGDIVSRFGSMGAIQTKISTDFIEGIVDGIMVIITLIMMLVYSLMLSAIVFGALALYTIIRLALYSTFRRMTQENLVAGAKESSIFMEGIRAILPLKIFGKETQRENIWQNCFVDKLNTGLRTQKLSLIYAFCQGIFSGIEYIIIVILGAKAVMRGGPDGLTVGMLMAYFSYRAQFVDKAKSLINKAFEYQLITLDLERVADIALSEPEQDLLGDVHVPRIIQGSIRVKNLSFRYSEQDPYVFKNINFEIKAGESVAIVGPSGCGKTTMMKMLMRLLAPSSGEIFIDDVDITRMGLHNYRSQIAAVMQEDILLSGSIADNICFFDTKPDFDRIYACAMIAAIHDDIISMPMAYQSLVGDMGSTLSGGQKQRVLLARALYVQPKILFLDEATSHLDSNNEHIINQHVKQIGITRIIVAHRQETVQIADRIIDLAAMIQENYNKE